MKLFNLFKKETSKEVKSNIQKMDKNQLSKVIGGVDTKIVSTKWRSCSRLDNYC
jgi:bacteriocin-like protein